MGFYTILSRLFGIVREVLFVRYLGQGVVSDAFVTAFKIPSSLRKFFAEGALSAALVPTISGYLKSSNVEAINALIGIGFLIFGAWVALFILMISIWTPHIVYYVSPGFSEQQTAITASFLKILSPFVLFVSLSSLFAAPLQAMGNILVIGLSPIVLNITFITGCCVGLWYHTPPTILCWFILFGGFLQLIMHGYYFKKEGFSLGITFDRQKLYSFWSFFLKFLLCLPSVSIMELSLFIDTSFASFLPSGQLSLLYYANRFANIPLGVFVVSFSTVLLPVFSRMHHYRPRRLHFHLFEALKVVIWTLAPITLLLCYFAYDIFYILFFNPISFDSTHIELSAAILQTFSLGLLFFACNKIIVHVFYSLDKAWIPAMVSTIATIANALGNWLLLPYFQAIGLATATVLSAMLQLLLLVIILKKYFHYRFFSLRLLDFLGRYCLQLLLFFSAWVAVYRTIVYTIQSCVPLWISYYFLKTILLWVWVGIMALLLMISLWRWRTTFGIPLHFLEQ
jgi:putative peptidoglycan lipid II flippase